MLECFGAEVRGRIADRIPINFRLLATVILVLAGAVFAVNVQGQLPVAAPAGLISWWPGDTNGADIYSTNNGSLFGGATAGNPGVDGGAFLFDGTNGYFAIPDAPALHPTNLTIEGWVRSDNLNATPNGGYPGQQYIVFHQNAEMFNFEGFDFAKDRRTNGVPGGTNDTWCFEVTSTDGLNTFVESQTYVHTNVWYHFAGIRDATNIYLYVNGVLEAQTPVTFPQSYGPFPLYFSDTGENYYDPKFCGALDEVSLYNRALASNEIYAIYAAGRSGKAKKPTMISYGTGGPQTNQIQLLVAGIPGQTYGVQATSALGASNTWTGLTNVVLSASSNLWTDPAPDTDPAKFYRVLSGPISVP
jgi:hypothetical protein